MRSNESALHDLLTQNYMDETTLDPRTEYGWLYLQRLIGLDFEYLMNLQQKGLSKSNSLENFVNAAMSILTKNCSTASSCGNCDPTSHVEDGYMAARRCRNCGGPHRSESRRFFASPTCLGVPTKEQITIYKKAGEREYQAVFRAREAEARSEAAKELICEQINYQFTADESVIEEFQASPVEVPTESTMRL